jgi:hypothetical protein
LKLCAGERTERGEEREGEKERMRTKLEREVGLGIREARGVSGYRASEVERKE